MCSSLGTVWGQTAGQQSDVGCDYSVIVAFID
jgi:hypothetical protein